MMEASTSSDLSDRLNAVVAEAPSRVKNFQSKAEEAHLGVRERFRTFLPIAERITAMAREKLERLRERLAFEVTPAQTETERYYGRSVTLEVKSELAGVIKLSFRLGHDRDVTHIMLDYELEIIPVFFRFTPHDHLDIPLEAYDEAAVSKWLDDRIVDFANVSMELHLTRQYNSGCTSPTRLRVSASRNDSSRPHSSTAGLRTTSSVTRRDGNSRSDTG